MGKVKLALGAAGLLAGLSVTGAYADAIPYGSIGTPITTSYSFTATETGQIDAWFYGSDAADTDYVGIQVNGVNGSLFLDNHTTAVGTEADLGSVKKGDSVVFFIYNSATGLDLYSTTNNTDGDSHAYVTPYSGGVAGIPAGTYIGFEDLMGPTPNSDFDYNDTQIVFNNTVPEPSTWAMMGLGFIGLAFAGFRARKTSVSLA